MEKEDWCTDRSLKGVVSKIPRMNFDVKGPSQNFDNSNLNTKNKNLHKLLLNNFNNKDHLKIQ